MPRQPRLHAPGAFYHVTLRGNHRQNIFSLPSIGSCSTKSWLPLLSAVLVDADAYLLELLRYIHLNPVRAGMVNHATDYPWSSHHVYLGVRKESWVTTDLAQSMLHADCARAIDAYRHFVGGDMPSSPLREVNSQDPRVLGDDRFLARLLVQPWQPRSRKTLQQIIDEASLAFAVDIDELLSSGRQRHLTRLRAWIAHQALRQRIASICEVARALNRSESALRECLLRHYPPRHTRDTRDPAP